MSHGALENSQRKQSGGNWLAPSRNSFPCSIAVGSLSSHELHIRLGKLQTVTGGVGRRAWTAHGGKLVFNRPKLFDRADATAFQFQFHVWNLNVKSEPSGGSGACRSLSRRDVGGNSSNSAKAANPTSRSNGQGPERRPSETRPRRPRVLPMSGAASVFAAFS